MTIHIKGLHYKIAFTNKEGEYICYENYAPSLPHLSRKQLNDMGIQVQQVIENYLKLDRLDDVVSSQDYYNAYIKRKEHESHGTSNGNPYKDIDNFNLYPGSDSDKS